MDIAGNQTILCFRIGRTEDKPSGDISWHGTCRCQETLLRFVLTFANIRATLTVGWAGS